jgi:hypothetical protein
MAYMLGGRIISRDTCKFADGKAYAGITRANGHKKKEESIRKLAKLENIRYVFTAHAGTPLISTARSGIEKIGYAVPRNGKDGRIRSPYLAFAAAPAEDAGRWDERKSEQLIASAIDLGVNYFDTAYLYFGNEALVGKILSGERRDKVLLSTKLPPMQVNSRADMDRLLDIQLERLGTDRIDYYLLHSLMSF